MQKNSLTVSQAIVDCQSPNGVSFSAYPCPCCLCFRHCCSSLVEIARLERDAPAHCLKDELAAETRFAAAVQATTLAEEQVQLGQAEGPELGGSPEGPPGDGFLKVEPVGYQVLLFPADCQECSADFLAEPDGCYPEPRVGVAGILAPVYCLGGHSHWERQIHDQVRPDWAWLMAAEEHRGFQNHCRNHRICRDWRCQAHSGDYQALPAEGLLRLDVALPAHSDC